MKKFLNKLVIDISVIAEKNLVINLKVERPSILTAMAIVIVIIT